MTAPPMLFGVDAVDVARVTRAMSYSGPAYTRHVAHPPSETCTPTPASPPRPRSR
ncbi:hypothetical protein [Lentzea guizhouensis]|uniref:hypothetical protein n=1 Tax=Lentzea guizhouensis TaxID=1586287 RepID=UPI001F3982DB|nr:hypothetical protein [Lentzea guizhouensis]